MGDSPDMTDGLPWNEEEDDAKPTPSELEAAGQTALFGELPKAEANANSKEAEPAPANGQEKTSSPAPPEPKAAAAEPDSAQPAVKQPYRVLARKYRPQTFSELIGQEPMVRTLGNAIARDRLAHAFLMTGVRGVGKTSTARLIAKALNCIGPDGKGGPTIDPCGQCEPCVAIAEGRHIDVIEMDAASHTGVDDVREIIEAVRYSAVSARYKIYIIDEVHMLSRNAFNALLKTLEEPPAHVKFLFATTEVDKLPVTVLSRTQRFDLRRIPAAMLRDHFAWVCEQEGVGADAEPLDMIAAAAEGSVRDGLSILDQAIAYADMEGGEDGARVTAERVRAMLGLADKSAQRKLLGAVLAGEPKVLLDAVADQYALGVEPIALMRTLMDLVHRITVAQIGGTDAEAPSAEESAALTDWAKRLSAGQLHRLWQLLLKGHDEVRQAPDPLVSAQMALLRIMYAADLPDPGMMMKRMEELAQAAPSQSEAQSGTGEQAPSAAKSDLAGDWQRLVDRVEEAGCHHAASIMRLQVRPIGLSDNRLSFSRDARFRDAVDQPLREALARATGARWIVTEEESGGLPSLFEVQAEQAAAVQRSIEDDPLVKATLAHFPQARFVETDGDAPRGHDNWSKSA